MATARRKGRLASLASKRPRRAKHPLSGSQTFKSGGRQNHANVTAGRETRQFENREANNYASMPACDKGVHLGRVTSTAALGSDAISAASPAGVGKALNSVRA